MSMVHVHFNTAHYMISLSFPFAIALVLTQREGGDERDAMPNCIPNPSIDCIGIQTSRPILRHRIMGKLYWAAMDVCPREYRMICKLS